jgi:DNA helicase-2/ATP-dependent DNA helicase PcrA
VADADPLLILPSMPSGTLSGTAALEQLLEGLNPAQREAVLHPEGPLLILAGAGSGKTRVLTHRLAHLVYSGLPPERILAITFTNRAAREMADRVRALLGDAGWGLPWLSTFHSACARILRSCAERVGLTQSFSIYDQTDSRRLIKDLLEEEGYDPRRFPESRIQGEISAAKNRLLDAAGYRARGVEGELEEVVSRVFARYEQALLRANAVDFDDLLLHVVRLLERDDRLRDHYSRLFLHVLVDEYQDTNPVQYRLLQLLMEGRQGPRNLAVVGDDAQSIYAFRGADVRNILGFERDFPEAKVVRLEQNYRSTQLILEAANGLIVHNRRALKKRLWSDLGEGEPVYLIGLEDDRREAYYVAEELERFLEEGGSLSEAAVFYRTHALSRTFEEAFTRLGIPYRLVGALRFFERAEVKDVLAYLRLLVNPWDRLAFARAVAAPRRGVGEATVAKLGELAVLHGRSPLDLAGEAQRLEGLSGKPARGLEAFATLLRSLQERRSGGMPVAELITAVIAESGLGQALREEGVEGEARLENLDQLVGVARDRERELAGERLSLEGFLQQVSLSEGEGEEGLPEGAVTLTTLHNAKGTEFPLVFIVGLEEGLLPHFNCQGEEEVEEERRLLYVGITRAMRRLYLTYAFSRFRFGKRREDQLPSRFLEELPRGVVVDPQLDGVGVGRTQTSSFAIGERVTHDLFGPGTVCGFEGEGVVRVRFEDGAVRTLLLEYAKLRRL